MEGRRGRFDPIGPGGPRGAYVLIDAAIAAGAAIVIDTPTDRARPYNVGERQIAAHLLGRGYVEREAGVFMPG